MATILIVEDDIEIRGLVEEMLLDKGYRVLTAGDGRAALAHLRATRPCMVLLDLMMPVMDGWQLRAEMLADPALAAIPVVVVSGAADLQSSVAALKASRILTKPVGFPAILESVQAHCG